MSGAQTAAPTAVQTAAQTAAQTTTGPLLEVKGLSKSFSGLRAVADLDLRVERGEILAIIGPNGAGKTTVFNLLSRTHPATTGSVTFDGRDILRLPAHKVTALGMVRTFQNLRLFQNMTALDNVKVARYCRTRGGIVSALLRSGRVKAGERETERLARELLEFVSLGERAGEVAKSLPYGDQKRLEIARALATDPRLLLLDEPAAGLNDTESAALVALLGRIRESGVTIVLIEHDMKVVMNLSERIVVLDHGIKLCEGTPEQVRCDPRVVEAYLGKAAAGGPA